MSKNFTHLHVHAETSTLDGIIKIDKLCEHTKSLGMSSIAITDHGVLSSVVDFWKAAKKTGIKPIFGMEAYITENENDLPKDKMIRDNYHCILLAINSTGLDNIIKLNNTAHLHNFYYKPRICIDDLIENHEGIIATSACLGGVISKIGVFDEGNKTFDDPENRARNRLELLSSVFKNRFYAEIQDLPDSWEQNAYNTWLIKKAKELNVPLIITADAHFLTENDYETHRLVIAKNTGQTLAEYVRDSEGLSYSRLHHIRSPDSMYESVIRWNVEEAFWNTNKIAEQCNVELVLGQYKYPKFNIEHESDYQEFLSWKKTFECGADNLQRR